MDIKELLRMPKSITSKDTQKAFAKIADELMHNYCIQCGEKKYYFAEIEFYYYDKENNSEEWNRRTYPRTDKEAGDLFFHYSGFDICFESKYSEGRFGGILIRSLFDNTNNRYITGPLLCVNEVLNACSASQKWPILILAQNESCEIGEPIERYGITYEDKNKKDEPLCYFDKNIKCTNRFEDATWDFAKKEAKAVTRYYHRF